MMMAYYTIGLVLSVVWLTVIGFPLQDDVQSDPFPLCPANWSCQKTGDAMFNGPQFTSCAEIMNSIIRLDGLVSMLRGRASLHRITDDDPATTYCEKKCDFILSQAIHNLTVCCGVYDQAIRLITPIFKDSCKKNEHGEYCVKEDGIVSAMFTSGNNKGQEFNKCISAYKNNTLRCPTTECTDILKYITESIGCCFPPIYAIYVDDLLDTIRFNELLETCGFNILERCGASTTV